MIENIFDRKSETTPNFEVGWVHQHWSNAIGFLKSPTLSNDRSLLRNSFMIE
jgi:hypothetical protein